MEVSVGLGKNVRKLELSYTLVLLDEANKVKNKNVQTMY